MRMGGLASEDEGREVTAAANTFSMELAVSLTTTMRLSIQVASQDSGVCSVQLE